MIAAVIDSGGSSGKGPGPFRGAASGVETEELFT